MRERELGVNPVSGQRHYLAENGYKPQFKTLLMSGALSVNSSEDFEVLVMVSVRDSLGAVYNATQKVKVTPKFSGLTQRLSFLESFYDAEVEAVSDVLLKIYNLNLLAAEITGMGKHDCAINSCSLKGQCLSSKECLCEPGSFLGDCSGTSADQSAYLDLKYKILTHLQDFLSAGSSPDDLTTDQMQKSVSKLLEEGDLADYVDPDQFDSQLAQIDLQLS